MLTLALRFRTLTLVLALLLTASALLPLKRLGLEFMPALYEGELLYMPTTLPGASATKMRELLSQTNRLIRTVPEVEQVFGKAGRSDGTWRAGAAERFRQGCPRSGLRQG